MSGNLIEAIQQQQARFRDVLIPAYTEIGNAGKFCLLFVIKPLMVQADVAIATGDVVKMVEVLKEMQEVKE
jgi:hypothetical protein